MHQCERYSPTWLSVPPLRLRGRVAAASLLFLFAVTLVGCDLPKDIEGTQDHVRGGTLLVGVIDGAAPWAKWVSGEPRGIEVQLVRDLARQMEADIQWVAGSDTELFRALAAFELDLVIGGIEHSSPWRKDVALSRPYFVSRVKVGWPPDRTAKEDLDGLRIAVKPHTSVVKKLKDHGAVPVPWNASADTLPLAAPEWQIRERGLAPSPPTLDTRKRVFALPPGENRWLHTVQRFLFERRGGVPEILYAQRSDSATRVLSGPTPLEGGSE